MTDPHTTIAAPPEIAGQLTLDEAMVRRKQPDELPPALRAAYDALVELRGPAPAFRVAERLRRETNIVAARLSDLVKLGLARQLAEKVPGPHGKDVAQWELIS